MKIYTVELDYEAPHAFFATLASAEAYVSRCAEAKALHTAWLDSDPTENFDLPAEFSDIEDEPYHYDMFIREATVRP